MSTTVESAARSPGTSIDPIPQRERVLSAVDLAILWGDFGIGLLVLVTGALLVPGLGFAQAMVAIVVGSIIGVGLLATAGYIGARRGVPTMVLFRPILGVRGSWLPSALNAAQLVGWTAVEFWAMSSVADLVSRRIFGLSARPLWLAAVAVLCTLLALWGPVGVTRGYLRRFGAWLIVAISAIVTVLVLVSGDLGSTLTTAGKGGFPSFGGALDLVIAMPVSWLPLVADYNRFAASPRSAATGTWWGYLVANIWLYGLGALLVLGPAAVPSPAGVAGGVLALAGGSVAGLLFLVGLLVGETDEAFADMYSGAVSLQNILSRVPQSVLIVTIAGIAAALAAWLTMGAYESFLFLLGSVFVPLFGVLIGHFVLSQRAGSVAAASRWSAFVSWFVGFAIYQWIAPTGPPWWLNAMDSIFGPPLAARFPWLAASIPSFLAAFILMTLITRFRDAYHSPPRQREVE